MWVVIMMRRKDAVMTILRSCSGSKAGGRGIGAGVGWGVGAGVGNNCVGGKHSRHAGTMR